jgi:hypothetical protein
MLGRVAVAAWRMTDDAQSAWEFDIPGELLAVMGITLGSSVSALALKSVKDNERAEHVAARLPGVKRPPIADMFAVEEGDAGLRTVDITKLQSFFISLAMLVSYVWLVIDSFSELDDGTVPSSLPEFSETMVGLLALSHGGYLVGKLPNRDGSTETPVVAGIVPDEPHSQRAGRTEIITVAKLRTLRAGRMLAPTYSAPSAPPSP